MPYSPISGTDVTGQVTFSTTTTSVLSVGGQGFNILRLQVSGTFTTVALAVEGSENASTWISTFGFGSDQGPTSSITAAGVYTFIIGSYSNVRLNCTFTSGTSMIVDYTLSRSSVVTGGNSTGTNTPFPIVSVVARDGGIQPSGASAGAGIFTKMTDGVNTPSVKTASTVPSATDTALTVSLSPNSSDAIKGQATMGSGTTTTILSPTSGSSQSYNILRIWPSGTFNMIVQAQGSVDNVTWTPLYGITPLQNVARDNNTAGTMATYAVGGYPYLRLTTTSFTSGSMVVDYSLSRSHQFHAGGAQGATPFPIVSIGDQIGGIMPCGQSAVTGITIIPADAARNSYNITANAQTNNIFSPVAVGGPSTTANVGAGYATLRLQSQGTFSATALVEGSVDGVSWTTISGVTLAQVVVSSFSTSQIITYNVSGYSSVRTRCTAYTSGTLQIDYSLSKSTAMNYGGNGTTPFSVTSIGDANGQAAVAGSGTATIPTTSALGVSLRPSNLNYFSASAGPISPAATATDILTIAGNATTTVVVTRFTIQTTQTTAGVNTWVFVKRSTANTGGTSSAAVNVPYDSTGAATGSSTNVQVYSANPSSLGTAVGNAKVVKLFASTPTTGPEETFDWDLTCGGIGKGMALRGTSQVLALNFQGASVPTGLSVQWNIEWYEY